MRRWRAWALRLAGVFGGGRPDDQMVAELEAHRDLLVDEYVRAGMDRDKARRRAAADFGSLAAVTESYRDRRGWPSFEAFVRNLRLACRSLTRTPVLFVSMVVVLGLGIGLSTALVAVFHSVVVDVLPVPQPHAVMRITQQFSGEFDRRVQGHVSLFSYPEVSAYRQTTRALAAVTGVLEVTAKSRDGEGRSLDGVLVAGDYFKVFAVAPALGRLLTPNDARQPVAVISYQRWTSTFASRPDAIGSTLWLDDTPYTIVGVAPAAFTGSGQGSPSFWAPLEAVYEARGKTSFLDEANVSWLQVFGRLSDGASIATARAEAAVIAAGFDRAYPTRRTSIDIRRAARVDTKGMQGQIWTVGGAMFAFVVILFLICGSNAAGLLLARDAARQKEIAVRLALGATRLDIMHQLFAELLVIAGASALLGVGVCMAALRALARVVAMPDLMSGIALDARVFGIAMALACVVLTIFGLAPLRQALRVDCLPNLKGEASMLGTSLPGLRLRRALIAVQIGISVLLLVVAALIGRGVAQAWRADPGFTTRGLFAIEPDTAGRSPSEREATPGYSQELASRLRSVPGVRGVGLAGVAPFFGKGISRAGISPSGPLETVQANAIDGEFLSVLGVGLIAGRPPLVGESDACVINARLARRFWSDAAAAIGRTLFVPSARGDGLQAVRVVGVSPTIQSTTIGVEDEATYYTALDDAQASKAWLVVRADDGIPLRQIVSDVLASSQGKPQPRVTGLDAHLLASTAPSRVAGAIAAAIGVLALLVAAVGVHGVISYTVAARVHDIGLYRALGARPAQVLWLIFDWTLRGVAIGVGIVILCMAVIGAVAGSSLLTLFNGVNPLDVTSFAAGLTVMAIVIGLAAYVPARRALGMSPLAALRREG